jgi:hypothetical protein
MSKEFIDLATEETESTIGGASALQESARPALQLSEPEVVVEP